MQEMRVDAFTDALAAKVSVPGGGGASALAGALGMALGEMVGAFTVGKKKYADVEARMQMLMEEARSIRGTLLRAIQQDAEAFEPLSRAYGISRDDPTREPVMEACLHAAADVPMQILEASCRAVELLEEIAQIGSTMMISDAATGATLCRGAILGAAVNIKVNTHLMKDRTHAEAVNHKTDAYVAEYAVRAEKLCMDIYGRYA